MRNRRIGQHSLNVVLRNRDDIADRHREYGQHHERSQPRKMNLTADRGRARCHYEWKSEKKNAQKRSEARGLRTRGHESGDGSRRAFVNVRRPNVERGGGDLEAKANEHHGGAREE